MKIAQNSFRFQSDKRQFGGLLMLLSFCLIVMPLASIAGAFGPDGANTTDASTIPFWGMFGGLCIFITGVAGVITGYMAAVHDWSHWHLTVFLKFAVQTAWISYMTDMVAVGQGAKLPAAMNMFIPMTYSPEDADVKFVGAMGVISILCYGFAFAGSMAFMVWGLHAYNIGMPESHNGNYFKARIPFYSGVLAVAGLAQFLLGAWCQGRFDMDVLEKGPVKVAFLVVVYPGISMFIGLLQFINGVWGIARSLGYFQIKNVYQFSMAFQWIMVLALQNIAQIAYLPGGTAAPVAPTLAAFSLSLTLFPAYLDYKISTLPDTLPHDYYSDMITHEKIEEMEVSATHDEVDNQEQTRTEIDV